jgi:hypothetical protein
MHVLQRRIPCNNKERKIGQGMLGLSYPDRSSFWLDAYMHVTSIVVDTKETCLHATRTSRRDSKSFFSSTRGARAST